MSITGITRLGGNGAGHSSENTTPLPPTRRARQCTFVAQIGTKGCVPHFDKREPVQLGAEED